MADAVRFGGSCPLKKNVESVISNVEQMNLKEDSIDYYFLTLTLQKYFLRPALIVYYSIDHILEKPIICFF